MESWSEEQGFEIESITQGKINW